MAEPWEAMALGALHALHAQQRRDQTSLNLIPSENGLSPLARLPMGTDAAGRYHFDDNPPGTRAAFPAATLAAAVETDLTLPLMRRLTAAEHVTVRPLSGLQAMTVTLAALGGPPTSAFVSVHPGQGGHYATAPLARHLGLNPLLAAGPDPHTLDLDQLADLAAAYQPPLVYVDQCHGLFPFTVTDIAAAVTAGSPRSHVHVDVSHWFGLLAGGAVPNPLQHGAHSVSGSTHKTFPGPQKGFVATNDPDTFSKIKNVLPVFVSNHHLGASCGLGLAAAEFLATDGPGYARTTVAAAQALGAHLHQHGLTPEAIDRGVTASHQLWVRTSPAGIDAHTAADRLYHAGINVNVLVDLPGTGEPALRLGLAEAVYHGLTVADMAQLADLITRAALDPDAAGAVASQIAQLRTARTSPYHLHGAPDVADATIRLTALLAHGNEDDHAAADE